MLTIAGFDPSGGAGLLADAKTFEALGVQGMGVCSALTFQNDKEFDKVRWIYAKEIIAQLEVLYRRFDIEWVKIGLIERIETLEHVVEWLKNKNPEVKIIWDPIWKASAGFSFHDEMDSQRLVEICSKLFLVTPNMEEIHFMFPGTEPEEAAEALSYNCNVLLKSAYKEDNSITDILLSEGEKKFLDGRRMASDKHGTGCVLSSALLAHLALGRNIHDACLQAKLYTEQFRASNETLLGYHNFEQVHV